MISMLKNTVHLIGRFFFITDLTQSLETKNSHLVRNDFVNHHLTMLVMQVGITQATEICLEIREGILAVTRSLIHLTGGDIVTDLTQSLEAESGHLVQSYILTVPLSMKVP